MFLPKYSKEIRFCCQKATNCQKPRESQKKQVSTDCQHSMTIVVFKTKTIMQIAEEIRIRQSLIRSLWSVKRKRNLMSCEVQIANNLKKNLEKEDLLMTNCKQSSNKFRKV